MKAKWYLVKVRLQNKEYGGYDMRVFSIQAYTAEDAVFQVLGTDAEFVFSRVGSNATMTREEKKAAWFDVMPHDGDTTEFYKNS